MTQQTTCGSHENSLVQDVLRVHDCLYNGCWVRSDECARCDAVVAILRAAARPTPAAEGG